MYSSWSDVYPNYMYISELHADSNGGKCDLIMHCTRCENAFFICPTYDVAVGYANLFICPTV